MSIFERLARLARAEFNHVKAVITDRDDEAPAAERAERLERLRRAQEELERAEAALRQEQLSDGASAWGRSDRGTAADDGAGSWRADDGASAWRRDDAARGAGVPGASARGRGASKEPQPTEYPQEIRLAYAALELPLGADREQIKHAYRELLNRYHPDKHAANPQLAQAANELTRRIKEARDRLVAWLH